MTSLVRCIYSSIATPLFNEDSLPELLKKSRVANTAIQVTGLLAYVNGHFLQVIEGTQESIDQLMAKIKRDARHKRMFVIAIEPITHRMFGDWSMGFEALLPAEIDSLIGENDFFDSGSCFDALDAGMVKTVLLSFRKSQTESVR